MKRIRIPVLAVLGVLALVAFAGSASASAATVLCKANESPCSNANVVPAGGEVGGAGLEREKTIEMVAGIKFTCTGGSYGAKTTKEAGNPLEGTGFAYTMGSNCTSGGVTCTEATYSASSATISATGNGTGTVTYGTASEHFTFKLVCKAELFGEMGNFTCKWGSSSIQFHATPETYGTTEAPLTVEEATGYLANTACGKVGATAKLTVTALTPEWNPYIESF